MHQANGHMDGVERREILAHFLAQPAHAVAIGCRLFGDDCDCRCRGCGGGSAWPYEDAGRGIGAWVAPGLGVVSAVSQDMMSIRRPADQSLRALTV